MFKVGDEVYLREGSRWNNGNTANPLGVVGTIDEDNYDDYGVMWSNGFHNSAYTEDDLMLATEVENTDPLVEIRQSEYTALIEEINLLQELLAEANIKLGNVDPTTFKPITYYNMTDWQQALNEKWVFKQRDGSMINIISLDYSEDTIYPVETESSWLRLNGAEWEFEASDSDIVERIK